MTSLSSRLTVAVLAVAALSLTGFSWAVYSAIERALVKQFDERLADDAQALANMVEERASPPWELELSAFAQFQSTRAGGYYQLWMDDGTVLARSPSLGSADLSRAPGEEAILPDGRPGRRVHAQLSPRRDEQSPSQPTGRRLIIAVARATEEIDAATATLRALLWACGLTTLLVAGVAGTWAIRRGLRPVIELSTRIDAIDERRLADRLPLEQLPEELAPVVSKLNALLARLAESFARERQFTADASHELRTPIAGLRSILEVAASRERSTAEYRAALADALAVVQQMTGLVETLLVLATLEARPVADAKEEVGLRGAVDECLRPLASRVRERGLTVTNQISEQTRLATEPARLRVVISNLLSNAVEHTAEGGRVIVASDPSRGLWLEVSNNGPAIPPAALPRVFERFFRADPSRTGTGEHHGLGLAVVRGICQLLGAQVAAENRADGWVVFSVCRR